MRFFCVNCTTACDVSEAALGATAYEGVRSRAPRVGSGRSAKCSAKCSAQRSAKRYSSALVVAATIYGAAWSVGSPAMLALLNADWRLFALARLVVALGGALRLGHHPRATTRYCRGAPRATALLVGVERVRRAPLRVARLVEDLVPLVLGEPQQPHREDVLRAQPLQLRLLLQRRSAGQAAAACPRRQCGTKVVIWKVM